MTSALIAVLPAQNRLEGIRRAVTDEPLRQQLIARGRRRAQEFSWARAAAQTLHVYREVLGAA